MFQVSIALLFFSSLGLAGGTGWKSEADLKIERMEKRFYDYFQRQKARQQWEEKRRAGIEAYQAEKSKEREKRELGREKQIESRNSQKLDKWNLPEVYEDYLIKKDELKQEHSMSREKFIEKREFLKETLQNADKKLTDYQEYGLEL